MTNQFSRTAILLGVEAMQKLKNSSVAIFGVGGVGGYVAEALARSGVGTLDLFDNDTVSKTNINRQIYALHSTIGQYKTEVAAKRIADINPEAVVNCHKVFYMPDNADKYDLSKYNYIIDAIDTVTAKINNTNIVIYLSLGIFLTFWIIFWNFFTIYHLYFYILLYSLIITYLLLFEYIFRQKN